MIAMMCFLMRAAQAFSAYDCKNQSSIVESYSRVETDACPVSDRSGETEITTSREIV
jgi:hypothetical protein